MSQNLLDRVIAAVAPSWALARAHDRARLDALSALGPLADQLDDTSNVTAQADSSGPGGPSSPLGRWWRPRPRDAKADTLRHLPLNRAASRELARTSPIAVGAINTNVDRVVGTGLALSAQPASTVLGWSSEQAQEWKALVQREFSMWADSTECDIEQTLNFYQQQGLVLRSTLESGDTFTVLPDGDRTATQPYKLRLQVLEADRVGNPQGQIDTATIAGGVRLGGGGAPEAYFIYDQHPGGIVLPKGRTLLAGQWYDRVGRSGRRRVLHHFRKLRPGMPRGMPYLAPIVSAIQQISKYTEAEIRAAVISAYFTVFIETPAGNAAPVFDGSSATAAQGPQQVDLQMGAVVGLMPGEKPHVANPGRPNPNFDPFVQAIIKQIGMALGIPYELLVKQFNASFSASKAALLDAWVYFRSVRFWLAHSFCQPIYETWMAEAVSNGRVPAPGFFADPLLRWAYTRAAWPGDSMGSINPKDEVAAYVEAINARLMTRERAEWELWGTDWNDTFPQKEAEQKRMDAAGLTPVPRAGAAATPAAPAPATPPTPEDRK